MADFNQAAKLNKITLRTISGDREADIWAQCYQLDIFESILSPIIQAELRIVDHLDLLNQFPIIGEETLEFTFSSINGTERKMKFHVVGVTNKIVSNDATFTNYTLKLSSEELYNSSKALYYKKFKDQTSNIVKTIIGEISSKKVSVEETKGIDEITISALKPFQAIDLIRRRSISPNYKSSSFCFFENRDGYHFKTIEGIFKDGKGNIGDRIFFFDNNVAQDIRTVSYRNIIALDHIRMNSAIDMVSRGGIRNRITKYDMLTGKIEQHDFTNEDFEKIDKKSNPLHSDTFNNQYTDSIAVSMFVPISSDLPTSELPEKLTYLQAFTQKITQNMLRIWINGDSSISCGDVITCKIPAFTGLTGDKKTDRLNAGNYLISKCRHMFSFSGNVTYTQSLELIKADYLG